MSANLCFENLLGYSRTEDLCVNGWDDSYATSESGLYIDELQGMSLRTLNSVGGKNTIWDIMANANQNAINAFKIDAIKEILKTKEPARLKFFGDIGGKSFTTTLSDSTYHGLRMYSDVNGGAFTLRGITLILNVTEAVTLEIWSGQDEEDGAALLHSIPLTSLANRPKYNAITPIELPLDGNLYFLYTTNGVPYNNKLGCNCNGTKWCFNVDYPCYKPSRDKWTEWAMVAGVYGDDITIRDDWATSREARGLVLHGDFNCDTLGILCSDHSDFVNNEIDSAIAWAVLYKAGVFLSTYIMDSEEVNRYTLLGVDQLGANIAFYEERYKTMIEFIADNIEEDRNECLKCRNPHGYARQSQML